MHNASQIILDNLRSYNRQPQKELEIDIQEIEYDEVERDFLERYASNIESYDNNHMLLTLKILRNLKTEYLKIEKDIIHIRNNKENLDTDLTNIVIRNNGASIYISWDGTKISELNIPFNYLYSFINPITLDKFQKKNFKKKKI